MRNQRLLSLFLLFVFMGSIWLLSPAKTMGALIWYTLFGIFNFLATYYAVKFYTPKTYLKGTPEEYARKSLNFVESGDLSALLHTVTGSNEELVPILKAAILVPPLIFAYRADTAGPELNDREGMTSHEMKSLLYEEFYDIPKDDIKVQLAKRIQHYLSQISPPEREAFLSRIFAYVDSKPTTEELLDLRRSVPSSLAGHTN